MRLATLMAMIAGGCDGPDEERPRPVAPPAVPSSVPAAPSYRQVEEGRIGTVSGTVRWRGAVPAGATVAVTQHPELCGTERAVPSVEVGPRQGVVGAVIVLEGIREGRLPLPSGEASVLSYELRDCDLLPRVAATSVGSLLRFRNAGVRGGAVLHNVRIEGVGRGASGTWFDEGLPTRDATAQTTAPVGVHRIIDDAAHPWIESWLYVAPHPYVTVTGADGRFHLPQVPVGSYQIRLWHPGIVVPGPTSSNRPPRSAPIVLARPLAVSESEDSTTDFELDATIIETAGGMH